MSAMLQNPIYTAPTAPPSILPEDVRIAEGRNGRVVTYFDAAMGAIRVEATGTWTMQQADLHCIQLTALVEDMRMRTGRVRIFVDRRGVETQAPAIIDRIAGGLDSILRSGDRVAVLVASSLVKMQVRRSVDLSIYELFISERAAFLWLLAHD